MQGVLDRYEYGKANRLSLAADAPYLFNILAFGNAELGFGIYQYGHGDMDMV
jgi:hypothetical protein